jgi:sterol desaturase/sphingolipid hydroxylase (fatty acid hydroxylase superfamily)
MSTLSLTMWLVFGRLAAVLLEMALISRQLIRGSFEWQDSLASIVMRIGQYVVNNVLIVAIAIWPFTYLYEHRLTTLSSTSVWAWVVLVFCDDFAYYIFHRISHECRFWWAAHVNHHSSTHYNLATAARQSWTGVLVGTWAPWYILAWVGFPPEMIFIQSGINLFYQFWLHTEAVGKLPRWFEAVFNTPSHHRVHHAANPLYLDRNYAGMFIIWDKWFGTFQEERSEVPCQYGLIHNIESYNPIVIAFHEWVALFKDVWNADSFKAAWSYIFRSPGWQPDGQGPTADNVRRAAGLMSNT